MVQNKSTKWILLAVNCVVALCIVLPILYAFSVSLMTPSEIFQMCIRDSYMTEEMARERYGDQFELYWSKICEAADSTLGYVLTYDGQPILAAYHSTSNGETEDAVNVWSASVPYLVPVESEGCLLYTSRCV